MWCGQTSLEEIIRVLGERVQDNGSVTLAQPWQEMIPDLPVEATPALPAMPQRAEPAVTRVLVADDDPQMRRLIKMILEREGHHVMEAGDGLDALEVRWPS